MARDPSGDSRNVIRGSGFVPSVQMKYGVRYPAPGQHAWDIALGNDHEFGVRQKFPSTPCAKIRDHLPLLGEVPWVARLVVVDLARARLASPIVTGWLFIGYKRPKMEAAGDGGKDPKHAKKGSASTCFSQRPG